MQLVTLTLLAKSLGMCELIYVKNVGVCNRSRTGMRWEDRMVNGFHCPGPSSRHPSSVFIDRFILAYR
jgi:hypothetical protein